MVQHSAGSDGLHHIHNVLRMCIMSFIGAPEIEPESEWESEPDESESNFEASESQSESASDEGTFSMSEAKEHIYRWYVPDSGNGDPWISPYIVFNRLSHEALNNGMGNMLGDESDRWEADVAVLLAWTSKIQGRWGGDGPCPPAEVKDAAAELHGVLHRYLATGHSRVSVHALRHLLTLDASHLDGYPTFSIYQHARHE